MDEKVMQTENEQADVCVNCGEKLEPRYHFCPICGEMIRFTASEDFFTVQNKPQETEKTAAPKHSPLKIVLSIGIPVIACAIAAALLLPGLFAPKIAEGTYISCDNINLSYVLEDGGFTANTYNMIYRGEYEAQGKILHLESFDGVLDVTLIQNGDYLFEDRYKFENMAVEDTVAGKIFQITSDPFVDIVLTFSEDGSCLFEQLRKYDYYEILDSQYDSEWEPQTMRIEGTYQQNGNVITLQLDDDETTLILYNGYLYYNVYQRTAE